MKTLLPSLLAIAAGFGVSRLAATGSSGDGAPVSESRGFNQIPSNSGPPPAPVASPQPKAGAGAPPTWQSAANAWAAADPAGFHRWLLKRGITPGGDVLEVLFTQWVKQDPDAAFEAAFNLPGDFQRHAALTHAMFHVLERPGGLAMALKWNATADEQMESWGFPEDRAWMSSLPPDRIAALLGKGTEGRGFYPGSMAGAFAGFWAEKDLSAAVAWTRSLPAGLRAESMGGIMKSWASKDPAGLLQHLATDAGSLERSFASQALTALAKTDPKAAMDWWETHLGTVKGGALKAVFGPWCKADSQAAREYALSVDDPTLRRSCLAAWGGSAKPEELLRAAREITGGADKTTLMRALVGARPNREVESYVRDAVVQGSPGMTPADAALVSRRYANRQPADAFSWVAGIPEKFQSGSLWHVFDAWDDKTAASQAVEQLPESSFKTKAREALRVNLADPDRGK
ncbi:MAG: hypothetical protein V4726_22765 [Verrucomicrobiota bacterium]